MFVGGDITKCEEKVAWFSQAGRNATCAIIDYLNKKTKK